MSMRENPRFMLFHGTSSVFIPGIKQFGLGGNNALEEMNFYRFIQELEPLCRDISNEFEKNLFCKFVHQTVNQLNFQHGQTYLTPSKFVAARYAAGNSHGSELVSETADRVKRLVGKKRGVEELLARYPVIESIINSTPERLLVSVPLAECRQLLTESGEDSEHQFKRVLRTLQSDPDNVDMHHQQDNFRLVSPVPFECLSFEKVVVTGERFGFPVFEIVPLRACDA